jgi:hypothetical protein
MNPVLQLRDVSRRYDDGAGELAALSSVSLSVAAGGRAGRRDGPQRLRQVDAAAAGRRP